MSERDHDPSELLRFAVYRLTQQHPELRRRLSLRSLVTYASEEKIQVMIDWYAGIALQALSEYPNAAVVFGRHVAEAAVIALPLRQQAQGTRMLSPDNNSWLLLVMAVAAIYTNNTSPDQISNLFIEVSDLAGEISAL